MVNHLEPNYIKKYDIYDILYNDNGELIIITPFKPHSYIINYTFFYIYRINSFNSLVIKVF